MTDTGFVSGPQGTGADPTADAVGNNITSEWVPSHPNAPITQAWGQTSYQGEPAGHGYPHWHAGVDVGYPSNSIVQIPVSTEWWSSTPVISGIGNFIQNLTNQAPIFNAGVFHRGVWNGKTYSPDPGGYGDHATTITMGNVDVILGHGVAWLQNDGATVRPGDQLIKTDCEGNCSGPHLHFEVRPKQGSYGSDVDPWPLFTGNGTAVTLNNPASGIGDDIQQASDTIAGAITTVAKDAVEVTAGIALAGIGAIGLGFAVFLFARGTSSNSGVRMARSAVPRIPTRSGARHPAARVARARGTASAPAAPRRLRGGEAGTATLPRPATTGGRVGSGVVQRIDSSREAARSGYGRPTGFRERMEARMNEAALARGRLIEANRARQAARPGYVPFKNQF